MVLETTASAGVHTQATHPRTAVYPRWWVPAAVLMGFVIMVARRPDGIRGLYLWGEDGTVFLTDAWNSGPGSLLEPSAAQWWVIPRLVAWPIVYVPAQWWPLAAYLTACVVTTAALAVVLQKRACGVLGPLPLRMVLFFVLVAQPLAFEIHGNLANIHVWLAMALLVMLVLPAPASRGGRLTELTFIGLAGLNGFLGVVVWPVAAWGYLRRRTRFGLLRLAVTTAAAVTNVLVSWGTRTPGQSTVGDYVATSSVLLLKRFAGGMLLGDTHQLSLWADGFRSWWLLPALLLLIAVGFLAISDRHGPSPAWLVAGLLWVLLGTSAVIRGPWDDLLHPFVVGRYLDLLVAATLLIVFRALSRASSKARIVAACVLAAMSFSIVTGVLIPQAPLGVRLRLDPVQRDVFGDCMSQGASPCTLPILPFGWTVRIDGRIS